MSEEPGPWLGIVGIGEDGVDGLSGRARAVVAGAGLVVGGARHLALAADLLRAERQVWPSPIADAFPAILARRGHPVAVLASGDPFWFGVGSRLAELVPSAERVCLPAPSAAALACARLGWAQQDIGVISFCGRPLAALRPLLQPGTRLLCLSADASTPAAVAAFLSDHGAGGSRLHVLEAMGGKHERHRVVTAAFFALDDVHPLNTVAIEVAPEVAALPLAPGLPDEMFGHDGQLTKREIRALTLSALAPRTGELLWDVGLGAGSVAIEWLLRHPANRAIGIERDPTRAARARANAAMLGVPSLRVVEGAAPLALAGLPVPDAVFLGGGGADEAVLGAAWGALRGGGRLVANAVTIETETVLLAFQRKAGGTMTRLGLERLDSVGRRRAFRPAMTVTQLSATKGRFQAR